MKRRIVTAPQEAVKFTANVLEVFLYHVMGIDGAFFTDESTAATFMSLRAKNGTQISENEWEFKTLWADSKAIKEETGKDYFDLTKAERKAALKERVDVYSREDITFDEDIIKKTKDLFDVDITSEDLDGKLTLLGLKLSQGMPPETRILIQELYKQLGV